MKEKYDTMTALLPHQIIRVGHYAGHEEDLQTIERIFLITQYGMAVGKTVAEAKEIWPRSNFYTTDPALESMPIFDEPFNFLGNV